MTPEEFNEAHGLREPERGFEERAVIALESIASSLKALISDDDEAEPEPRQVFGMTQEGPIEIRHALPDPKPTWS